MAQVNKIDSNITGLRYAEEASLKTLAADPVWAPLEPNSYNDFGGQVTTVARNPINPSRQRKKGVVTDLDASGGFNMDITQSNMQDLLQGFMFADFRRKGEEVPTNVDGTADEFDVASTTGFKVGDLVFGSGFTNSENNGLKEVAVVTANTSIEVVEDLVEEVPPADAKLVVVGRQFAAGVLDIDASGALPKLTLSGLVAATGTLTASGNAANNDTVTIGTQTYTFKTVLTGAANEVFIGVNASTSLDNLIAAINGAAGAGTTYGTGTEANTDVTALAGALDTIDVTAVIAGASGNLIASTEVSATLSWGGATLASGVGVNFIDMGLIAGEWIFVGGDAATDQFATDANNGFKRVRVVTDSELTIDKSVLTMVTEASTTETIQLFFGRVLRNESGTDIVRRSYQLERTLGVPDNSSPTLEQAEYLVGAIPNELTVNVPQANKATADLTFVACDSEQRTAAEGLKDGDRPAIDESDAFNTSSDFVRIKLGSVSAVDEAPDPLFAFVTEMTLSVNNNVSPNKAVGTLGAFDMTAGTFTVSATLTAYFSNVEAVQAVRNNTDVTLDWIMAKANAGIVFDLPLISLGDGRPNIEQDAPITLPLVLDAASAAKVLETLDYTLMLVFFDYLPDLAE